jgi:hypothetical protein
MLCLAVAPAADKLPKSHIYVPIEIGNSSRAVLRSVKAKVNTARD